MYVPGQGCAITQTDSKILAATFIYTMAFDFTVLSLTAWKLIFPAGGRSRLVSLIFNDGKTIVCASPSIDLTRSQA